MAPDQVALSPLVKQENKIKQQAVKGFADTTVNFNTKDYDHIVENKFLSVTQQPLSTFYIDVDRTSYANVRRYIEGDSLPPKGCAYRRNDQLF